MTDIPEENKLPEETLKSEPPSSGGVSLEPLRSEKESVEITVTPSVEEKPPAPEAEPIAAAEKAPEARILVDQSLPTPLPVTLEKPPTLPSAPPPVDMSAIDASTEHDIVPEKPILRALDEATTPTKLEPPPEEIDLPPTPVEIASDVTEWFTGLPRWVQSFLQLLGTTIAIGVIGSLAALLPEVENALDLIPIWIGVMLVYFPLFGGIILFTFARENMAARRARNAIAAHDEPISASHTATTKPTFIRRVVEGALRRWRFILIGWVSVAPVVTTIMINLDQSNVADSGDEFFPLMELTTVGYYLNGMVWSVILLLALLAGLGLLWLLYFLLRLIQKQAARRRQKI